MKPHNKPRIIVVSNLIYPLRDPVFSLLAKSRSANYFFVFLRENLKNRIWKVEQQKLTFPFLVLPGWEIPLGGHDYFAVLFNFSALPFFFSQKFEVIISIGWAHWADLCALFVAKLKGKSFILWNESTSNERSFRRTLAAWWVSLFVRLADAYLVSGQKASEYLQELGAAKEKIFVVGNAIDNNFYAKNISQQRRKHIVRNQLKINQKDFVFLYIGRFERVKNLEHLLNSFSQVHGRFSRTHLLLAGYGSSKPRLQASKTQNVYFCPEQSDPIKLLAYYAAADAVVLPSLSETWGYVLNEALACSIPVIASSVVGSVSTLVVNRKNGLVFNVRDESALLKSMVEMLSNKKLYSHLQKNALPSARLLTFESMSRQVENAVLFAQRNHQANRV